MNKKNLLIFLFCLPFIVYGQGDKSVKISVFKPEDSPPVATAKPVIMDNNCIKWNYSLMWRGVFLLNYEFRLNNKLSGEVGLGMTYRDFIYEVFSAENLPYSQYEGVNVNFCGEAGVRFYPKELTDFEGPYISPMISYRKYSLKESNYSSSGYNSTTTTTTAASSPTYGYDFLDLQFKLGYQYESLWGDLYGDFYVGFAMRNVSFQYQESRIDGNGNYIKIPVSGSATIPQALVGIKIGLPF